MPIQNLYYKNIGSVAENFHLTKYSTKNRCIAEEKRDTTSPRGANTIERAALTRENSTDQTQRLKVKRMGNQEG